MQRMMALTIMLALGLLFIFDIGRAWADGGRSVTVQPLTPKPGDVVTVKGTLLGPNSTVEVRLIGTGVDVDLGEVKADAEGDFSAQFRIPADLAPGNYQVQAKGAESETTAINVLAAGSAPADPMRQPAPVLRQRSLPASIGLVALFGVLAGLGILFARTAHREPVIP